LRFSRLPLLGKVLLAVNAVLIIAVTATGLSSYQVARDAIRGEVIAAGRQAAGDFARANALEFLDPERGPLELQLRLGQLVAEGEATRLLAGHALGPDGDVLASAGSSARLPIARIRALDAAALVPSDGGAIVVAAPVIYDQVSLGHVAFVLDGAILAEAGTTIFIQVAVAVLAFIILNVLGLWVLMRRVLQPVVQLGRAAEALAAGDYDHPLPQGLPEDEIGRAARSFENMRDALTVHMRFSNAALVDRIRHGRRVDEGAEHQLSVVFGDAVGYTAWSEDVPPEEVFSTLSRYYTCIGQILVTRFGGIIDKLIGDGIMAHFGFSAGAPRSETVPREHVQAALRATVYTQLALRAVSFATERFHGRPALHYRFGIASGRCLVGPFGAKDLMLDYSLIGNVVNLAARLERKAPPGGLLVDRFTRIDAGDGFLDIRDGGLQEVKGLSIPIPVAFVRGFEDEMETREMQRWLLDVFFDEARIVALCLDGDRDPEKIALVRAQIEAEVSERPFLPVTDEKAAD
jgi:class 3 adenylate cyclase